MNKISRNDPCSCGSGKKYKKCCMKKEEEARAKIMNPNYMLSHASEYPLVYCKINGGWEEEGLATVFVVRKVEETDKYLFASIVCDVLSNGVTEAVSKALIDKDVLEQIFSNTQFDFQSIPYEKAREIVLGSIEYARKSGIEPTKNWESVKEFIEWDKPCEIKMEFGKKIEKTDEDSGDSDGDDTISNGSVESVKESEDSDMNT